MFSATKGAGRLAVGVVLGLVLGLSTVGGVAVAKAAYDAANAHKVDGRHAVGAKAGAAKRAGKLVATNGKGKFPVGAIPRQTVLATDFGESAITTTTSASTPLSGASTTITLDRPGTLVATFAAETACYGGDAVSWCGITVLVDGTAMDGESDDAYDSNDATNETDASWESHSVTRTLAVPAGTHTVTVETSIFNAGTAATFRVDDWNLVVVGHM